MDTEIADLSLRERSRNGRPRNLGRIECTPIILDPRDQSLVPALNLDDNLQMTVYGGAIHNDVGDCLFETNLNGKRKAGRKVTHRPAFDPGRHSFQLGKIAV